MQIYKMNLNKNEKILLYVLKEMGAESEPVAITLEKLAEYSRTSRLTVHNSLKELKEVGLIGISEGTGKAPNSYTVKVEN
ncbi:hypothetical protein [Lysinibacillus capsici]|uniref:hypothetical protein n=1 Tax=Lysinibacillus capsici TaxID=2115968 RepID=UPI0034E2150C